MPVSIRDANRPNRSLYHHRPRANYARHCAILSIVLCVFCTLLCRAMNTRHTPAPASRLGGHILVDQLAAQGVEHVFCVPGESYLAVLDGLHDADIKVTVCRQEGGAAMMAEAHGKLTGKPGIVMVTRAPGTPARTHVVQGTRGAVRSDP